jgi:hypothetical protein
MKLRRPQDLIEADFPIPHRPFGSFAEVEPLLVLCERGKLYEVETWIDEGRPLQFILPEHDKLHRRSTPLRIAMYRRFHSLAALLLANGYDPNGDRYDQSGYPSVCLSTAVEDKDQEMVEMLLRFGANPHAVDFCTVLETCDRALMNRFIELGVDPCRENAVARSLDFKGRPILGFIKQYRDRFPCLQRQVDIALHGFTAREDLRGIALMLWLGGDPHAETSSSASEEGCGVGETAFESALWMRKPEVMALLMKRPIPVERAPALLSALPYHRRPDLVRRLLDEGADPNAINEEGEPVLYRFISVLGGNYTRSSPDEDERGIEALELLLKAGAKISLNKGQLKRLRRSLAAGESTVVIRLLELIHAYGAVYPEQFNELTRTAAMRRVLNGITKPRRDLLGDHYTPVPQSMTPVNQTLKRGYWQRHWSQC